MERIVARMSQNMKVEYLETNKERKGVKRESSLGNTC